MALLTSPAALGLLGILICCSFLGAEANTCAKDWLENHGNCYGYFDEWLTWAEAEIECQKFGRGAHLASVLTAAETDSLARHISHYQKEQSHVWIGLHDVRQNRRWKWSDGSTYNYKAWRKTEPNNFRNSEYCVELLYWTARLEGAGRGQSNYEAWWKYEPNNYKYRAWKGRQPDNYLNSEYCAELLNWTDFKQWNDRNCRHRKPYICKHKL